MVDSSKAVHFTLFNAKDWTEAESMLIDHELNQSAHPIFWWNIKVVCGFGLVASVFVRFLMQLADPVFVLPDIIPQSIVVFGGALFIYHYVLLKKRNATISRPIVLMKKEGLYKVMRHPMYFADMILFTGLALFFPHIITLAVLIVALFALYRQAKVEDLYLSQLFPAEHETWSRSTNLLLPRW